MFRGLYTATNSMRTNAKRLDSVTNNIANAQTSGFKKDVLLVDSFAEKLVVKRNGIEDNLRPSRQDVKIERLSEQENGAYRIEIKRGYLTMEDEQGKGYYKSAVIKRDEEGYLRTVLRDSDLREHTKFGAYLLDRKGGRIRVGEGELSLLPDGLLQVGGAPSANIIAAPAAQVIGTMNGGSRVDRTMINFSQGKLEYTENPLDLAIEGEGFFKVLDRRDGKQKYSRQGAFTLSVEGLLVDRSGNPVLSASGSSINIPSDAGRLTIDPKGRIYRDSGSQKILIDTIGVVSVENKEDMKKQGESYLVSVEGRQLREADFGGGVRQGYLEGSNVETIYEMVEMIETLRRFEADQKVIRSYDDIMNKAANEIGKLS